MASSRKASQKLNKVKSKNSSAPLPINKKTKLISKKDGKVLLEIDEKFYNGLLKMMTSFSQDLYDGNQQMSDNSAGGQQSVPESADKVQQEDDQSESPHTEDRSITPGQGSNQASNGVRETQDFYRRIPHFFMGRFKKWAKILNESEVGEFLQKLKQAKKSKQGRYELGDFHKCFQVDKNDPGDVQRSKKKIKELFLEFLQNEAVLQIIQYNKITTQEQKIKYIDVIPHMVQQMYSDKPFDQFLAQGNIEKQIKMKQQFIPEQVVKQQEDPPAIYRGESFKSNNYDH